jgi:hypothetical protein
MLNNYSYERQSSIHLSNFRYSDLRHSDLKTKEITPLNEMIRLTQSDGSNQGIIINSRSSGLLREITSGFINILRSKQLPCETLQELLQTLSPCLGWDAVYQTYEDQHKNSSEDQYKNSRPSLTLNRTLACDLLHRWKPGSSWNFIKNIFSALEKQFNSLDPKDAIQYAALTLIEIYTQINPNYEGFDDEEKEDIENLRRKSPLKQQNAKNIASIICKEISATIAKEKITSDITKDTSEKNRPNLVRTIEKSLENISSVDLIKKTLELIETEKSFNDLSDVHNITRLIHKLANDHPNTKLNIHYHYLSASSLEYLIKKRKKVFENCNLLLPEGTRLTFHAYNQKTNQYTDHPVSITPQGERYSQETLTELEIEIQTLRKSGYSGSTYGVINEALEKVMPAHNSSHASPRP